MCLLLFFKKIYSFFVGLVSHPLGRIFLKTFSCAVQDADIDSIDKQLFVVCPKDACNALYKVDDKKVNCTHTSFNKICGTSLGYYNNLAKVETL